MTSVLLFLSDNELSFLPAPFCDFLNFPAPSVTQIVLLTLGRVMIAAIAHKRHMYCCMVMLACIVLLFYCIVLLICIALWLILLVYL
jgi:hypothetical protein